MINSSSNVQIKNTILNDSILPKQLFSINIDSANNLITESGCVINIPSGAIECSSKNIQIEIREAISLNDIVKAGLFTKSNNEILSSRGMIFINSTKDYSIKIKKEIKVFVPTESYDKDIQLFTGETNKDGKINWTNPKPLPKNKLQTEIELGEKLFTQHCSSCHKMKEEMTGPPLLYCYKRMTGEADFNKFVRNSSREIASGDKYANCIFNQYNKTQMTSFENIFKKNEIPCIELYIFNESKKHPELEAKYSSNCCDSCIKYEKAKEKLLNRQQELIEKNPPQQFFNLNILPPNLPQAKVFFPKNITDSCKKDLVEKIYKTSLYYQFTINAPGWYNLDMYYKNFAESLTDGYLAVKVNSEKENDLMNVALIIPSKKLFIDGGKMTDNIQYAFEEKSGKIKLPIGEQAYVMATKEVEGKIFFDLNEFRIAQSQTIEINLKESSKQKIISAIDKLKLKDVSIDIKVNPHKKELLKIDRKLKELELLKPHNCNCVDEKKDEMRN